MDKKNLYNAPRWHEDVGAIMIKEENMTEQEPTSSLSGLATTA